MRESKESQVKLKIQYHNSCEENESLAIPIDLMDRMNVRLIGFLSLLLEKNET